jgi:hypothetical protein
VEYCITYCLFTRRLVALQKEERFGLKKKAIGVVEAISGGGTLRDREPEEALPVQLTWIVYAALDIWTSWDLFGIRGASSSFDSMRRRSPRLVSVRRLGMEGGELEFLRLAIVWGALLLPQRHLRRGGELLLLVAGALFWSVIAALSGAKWITSKDMSRLAK